MLISDCQNDGSFLVHHFLTMYIKGTYYMTNSVSRQDKQNPVMQLATHDGTACCALQENSVLFAYNEDTPPLWNSQLSFMHLFKLFGLTDLPPHP